MATLRVALTGTFILALLGGLSGAVVAQDDETAMMAPSGVVITVTTIDGAEPPSSQQPDQAYEVIDGAVFHSTWDATDPRLSGTATYTGMWHYYPALDVQLEGVAMTVVNDDGNWVGTGRGIYSPDAVFGDNMWLVMEGKGGYEGLTAHLTFDIANEEDTGRGFIFADELPPFPEPAE